MNLDAVQIEAYARDGHIQAPHAGAALADLADRLLPVALQVLTPLAQRHRVVLAQVLLVAHLEAVVVHRADDGAEALEFPVGEDVAIDEGAGALALTV